MLSFVSVNFSTIGLNSISFLGSYRERCVLIFPNIILKEMYLTVMTRKKKNNAFFSIIKHSEINSDLLLAVPNYLRKMSQKLK